MTSVSLVVLLVAARPVIASHLSCPSSRDIESQLSVLMSDAAQPGTVVVSGTTDGLLIDLRPDNPAFAAIRALTVGDDCDERARAAAVVISTWWPVTGTDPRRPEVLAVAAADRSGGGGTRARRFRLGAAAFASVVSDGTAPGARLEAGFLPGRSRGFGLRASAAFTASHESPVGRGQAQWSRATAELGPAYSLGHARFDVGVVASLFWIRGAGFQVNQDSQGSAMGATLGARTEWSWGRVVPWVEVRGILWPQSQTIYVSDATTGLKTSHAMPHAELQWGGGLALAF